MTLGSLERRVKALESRVSELRDELQSLHRARNKDWRRTIGALTDDEGVKRILQDAMRLREADRKKTRSKGAAKRGQKR